MYYELVKRLRDAAKMSESLAVLLPHSEGNATAKLYNEAADAIEFLQTYKTCFDNIVSMGGWWMVGQGKNLYRMNVPMNWPPKGTKTVELFPLPEPQKEERA